MRFTSSLLKQRNHELNWPLSASYLICSFVYLRQISWPASLGSNTLTNPAWINLWNGTNHTSTYSDHNGDITICNCNCTLCYIGSQLLLVYSVYGNEVVLKEAIDRLLESFIVETRRCIRVLRPNLTCRTE